jgi:hypothetical protein
MDNSNQNNESEYKKSKAYDNIKIFDDERKPSDAPYQRLL